MGGLALLTVFGATANFLHAHASQTIVNRTVTAIRRHAFHAALRSPLRFMVARGASDTISRIVNDTAQLANGFSVLVSKAVLQVFKGVAGLAAACYFDWKVTLAALTAVPLLYLVIRKIGKRIKKASGAAIRSQAGLLSAAQESLQSHRVVKVHTAELYEAGRFHRVNKEMLRELNRVRTFRALASPVTEMLSIFLLCGLVLVAGRAIIKGSVRPDEFILALSALAVAGASLKPLTGIINDVQAAAPAAGRLTELLAAPVEPGHGHRLKKLPRHARDIEFRAVTFTYPNAETPSLRDLSLHVPFARRIAIVGPNGSGKTTLLSLVPRLFDPDSGSVLIDGEDVRSISVRSLREQIAYVTQEVVLFRGTIASNIAYGMPGAPREAIIEAARRARAEEFILKLPAGYENPVMEGGLTLSGGQRQRIAIARAILRDPSILILDEATSMVDAESERHISAAVTEFCRGRTCLIVAHRMATVLSADEIVVMDDGRIIDRGAHADLLQRCEVYRTLASSQLG